MPTSSVMGHNIAGRCGIGTETFGRNGSRKFPSLESPTDTLTPP